MTETVNKKIKNATRVTIDGVTYRSKLEAKVAELFKEAGIDCQYEQERWVIMPTLLYNNVKYRAVTYTPDFTGKDFIMEVKGYPNDSWKLKKKVIINFILNSGEKRVYYEIKSLKEAKELIVKLKNNGHKEIT